MISIITIVNRDRRIGILLNKLTEITKPEPTEILVIDSSEGYLNDIKKDFPQVKWIYFHNDAKMKYTYSEQRNLGLKKAKGNILVFIDSDCIPLKNWLIELTKPIRKDGENIVAGLVKSIGKESINSINWEKMQKVKYLSECPTMNICFSKHVVSRIGLFSKDFNNGGEDIDFSWRATNNGFKIRYNNNAILYHDWGDLKKEIERAVRHGRTSVRLYKKHTEMLYKLFSSNADVIIYPIYIIFLPVVLFLPYYLLVLLIPLARNLLSKTLRKKALEKVFLDLVRGIGVLIEVFRPAKI